MYGVWKYCKLRGCNCFAFKLQAFQMGFHAIVYITRQHCFWVHSIGEKGLMELLMKRWCPNFPWKFWIIWNPVNNRIFIISTAAGFLPSTVSLALNQGLTNRDSSLAGSWTGQCCSKKQVLAHVGCETLAGKRHIKTSVAREDVGPTFGVALVCSHPRTTSQEAQVTPLQFDTKTYKDTPANLPSPARVL